MGDRPDAYRHWESIGLGTVPISNCPAVYQQLFGKNMVFLAETTMLELLNNPDPLKLAAFEFSNNKDIVCAGYWVRVIEETKLASFAVA